MRTQISLVCLTIVLLANVPVPRCEKNDPNSKAIMLGKAEGKFPNGEWQTLQVEIVGDKVAVQCDNGVKLEAKHPGLDIEKTGYRFVMRGSTLLLDDVNVWEVQP